MGRVFAIAVQTMLAALRMRVVVVASVALAIGVLGMPFWIRHNGTAWMFSQVTVTYNLMFITAVLAVVTLWLGAGAIAAELEAGQLQMVMVKPIGRWELWVGKWLGVLGVDLVLLVLSLTVAMGLMHWQAGRLDAEQLRILRSEVWVARTGLREASVDLSQDTEALVRDRLRQMGGQEMERAAVEPQMRALAKARLEGVAPNFRRVWRIPLGDRGGNQGGGTYHARTRFYAAGRGDEESYETVWVFGRPGTGAYERVEKRLHPGRFYELEIPSGVVGNVKELSIECENRSGTTLLFPLEDGLEVLSADGGFVGNVARGGIVIMGWLGALAAVGLAASCAFSFSTACLVSGCFVLIGLSGGVFLEADREGTVFGVDHETQRPVAEVLDRFMVPVFRVVRKVVEPVVGPSPMNDLSHGRMIEWGRIIRGVGYGMGVIGFVSGALGGMALRWRQLGLPRTGGGDT